jgi:hypothetical protein
LLRVGFFVMVAFLDDCFGMGLLVLALASGVAGPRAASNQSAVPQTSLSASVCLSVAMCGVFWVRYREDRSITAALRLQTE